MRPATEAGSWLRRRPEAAGGSACFFAAPIVPGKEETWRRFLQEVAESRAEYERLRGYLGLRRESVWLVPSTRGYATMVYLEVDGDLDGFVRRLAATEEDFDLWFKGGIVECHGRFERAKALPASTVDPIFSWGADPGRSSSTYRPDTRPSTEEGDSSQR